MLIVLVNALILLAGIGIPVAALFWKNFADKPSESIRALIATFAAMVGLAVFFLQTYIMTFGLEENLITITRTWLGS
jgi:hypothetical protein